MSSRRARWRSSAGLAAALACAAAGARAEEASGLGASGTARLAWFSRGASFSDTAGVGVASLWLTAKPREVAGFASYFDGRLQRQDFARDAAYGGDLREGYLSRSFGALDVKAGRQIIVWGRADKINPTDSWSTRDFTLLAPDDDDQRLGAFAAQAAWNAGNYHLIALWQPEWRRPGLPLPPPPPGLAFAAADPARPAEQFGAKLDHSGEGMDWSLSYARAYDRTPDLEAAGSTIGLRFPRVDVLGADAAVPVGEYGLRAEAAYARTPNRGGADPLAQDDAVFAVLGVERTFGGELNVNAQYLYKRVFGFRDPDALSDPATRALAIEERIIADQLAPDSHGLAFRIDHKAFNETLESELAAVIGFRKKDSFLRPKVSYAFTDRVKGVVGAQIWSGPTDSPFGRRRDLTAAFVETRIGF